jgi:hypothetical protein
MSAAPTKAPLAEQHGIVHECSVEGHRAPNQAMLANLFGLLPVVAAINGPAIKQLVGTPRLLLSTFDDRIVAYAGVALARGLLGRPTVGIVLRPQSCFGPTYKNHVKRLVFAAIKRIPKLKLLTIMPFAVEPHHVAVAHIGVQDPQYWDFDDGTTLRLAAPSQLSDDIVKRAAGRRIIIAPGTVTLRKGISFLADIVANQPAFTKQFFVVVAGVVLPECRAEADRLVAAGGVLYDFNLTDQQIESLYAIDAIIWACYAPEYDQASGIFGRAVQNNRPVMIRRGSHLDRFALELKVPVVRVDFGQPIDADALALEARPPTAEQRIAQTEQIRSWREGFVRTVTAALD